MVVAEGSRWIIAPFSHTLAGWRKIMKELISGVVRIYDFCRDGLAVIGGILSFLMVIYITASIFLRHTPYPIGWGLEAAEYSLIIITFFCAGWVLKKGGHTRIDIVIDMIKNRRSRAFVEGVLYVITAAVCLFLMVIAVIVTWENFWEGGLQVKVYTFPKWMLCAIIPIGLFFLVVESIKLVYSNVKEASKK